MAHAQAHVAPAHVVPVGVKEEDGNKLGGWYDVALASLGQAAFFSAVGVLITALALVTKELTAGSAALATTTPAIEMFARAAVSSLASSAASKHGRRRLLVLGSALGLVGSLVAWQGVVVRQYAVLLCGIVVIGVGNAPLAQLRFVAAEAVDEHDRPRALAMVVAGGTLAAVAGPELAKATKNAAREQFAASFLAVAGLFAFQIVLALMMRGGRPPVKTQVDAQSSGNGASALTTLMRSGGARLGAANTVTSWAGMILVMNATPMAMVSEGGHSFADAATALQAHFVGMVRVHIL